MNEEYLWNKTGNDPRIEGMENALKAFRYAPTAPPELPAKTFVLEQKPRRRFLSFGLAFASIAAVIAVGVWFLIPHKNAVISNDLVKTVGPQPTVGHQVDTPPAPKVELPIRESSPSPIKIRHLARPWAKSMNTLAFKPKDKDHPVTFTNEEKYAYGQLMLALSITESKLKIVRDTIAGNEEMKPLIEKQKNLYQK